MRSVKGLERQVVGIFLVLFFLLGCARVNLTSKDPIKLDVTMRLDIYQHVAKDADAIEDMISSPASKKQIGSDKLSRLVFGVEEAYAQEGSDYPANIISAIDARKARRSELVSLEAKGVIGENSEGLAELRDKAAAGGPIGSIVSDENNDRRLIYDYVARKNGTGVIETGKIFAERIQADAPSGTPIQTSDGNWIKK